MFIYRIGFVPLAAFFSSVVSYSAENSTSWSRRSPGDSVGCHIAAFCQEQADSDRRHDSFTSEPNLPIPSRADASACSHSSP